MRVRFLTYAGRVSAPRALCEALYDDTGALTLKQDTNWRARAGDLLINWGLSAPTIPIPAGVKVLNGFDFVRTRSSKLQQYILLRDADVPHVPFTTSKSTARRWLVQGRKVFCRVRDASFGGRGIVVASTMDELVDSPVYTQKFRARREYRVHVWCGQAIDVTQKRKENGRESNDIRSWGNGYVFCHNDVEQYPMSMVDAAVAAVAACKLDFGAVDILLKDSGECAVLEVNSAPGIEGTTLDRYAAAIRTYVRSVA